MLYPVLCLFIFVFTSNAGQFDDNALLVAAQAGKVEGVGFLLCQMHDPNQSGRLIGSRDLKETPLSAAIQKGEEFDQIVGALLDAGALPDIFVQMCVKEEGKEFVPFETALHRAVRIGDETKVELLVKRGASIDAEDHFGKTARQIAEEGSEGIIQILSAKKEE